jgi:polyisoprenoid-binding protein YceI
MSHRLTTALLLGAASLSAFAADSYTIDSRHTYPVFEVNHLGFSTQRGRFNSTKGKITLDPQAGQGSIDVTIDTASIDMGLEPWDKIMRGEDWFKSESHPWMLFRSNKLVFDGGKPVAAEGTLTLLDASRPVTLKIESFHCGTHPINRKALCGADVSTTIKRSEFGMSKYLPSISDEVVIKIPVEAFKD